MLILGFSFLFVFVSFKINFLVVCIYMLTYKYTYSPVHSWWPPRSEEEICPLWTGVTDSRELPCGCWEVNVGSLKKLPECLSLSHFSSPLLQVLTNVDIFSSNHSFVIFQNILCCSFISEHSHKFSLNLHFYLGLCFLSICTFSFLIFFTMRLNFKIDFFLFLEHYLFI